MDSRTIVQQITRVSLTAGFGMGPGGPHRYGRQHPLVIDKIFKAFVQCRAVFEFRIFEPEDLHDIMNIVHRELRYEYNPDFYLKMHTAWKEGFIVATYFRKIIGFIVTGITTTQSLRILLVATSTEFKKKGVASSLLDHITKMAISRRISRVFLEVRVENENAIKFYQRKGYIIRKKVSGFYNDGGDAYVMERILSS